MVLNGVAKLRNLPKTATRAPNFHRPGSCDIDPKQNRRDLTAEAKSQYPSIPTVMAWNPRTTLTTTELSDIGQSPVASNETKLPMPWAALGGATRRTSLVFFELTLSSGEAQ